MVLQLICILVMMLGLRTHLLGTNHWTLAWAIPNGSASSHQPDLQEGLAIHLEKEQRSAPDVYVPRRDYTISKAPSVVALANCGLGSSGMTTIMRILPYRKLGSVRIFSGGRLSTGWFNDHDRVNGCIVKREVDNVSRSGNRWHPLYRRNGAPALQSYYYTAIKS